jgi:hypothetical protein
MRIDTPIQTLPLRVLRGPLARLAAGVEDGTARASRGAKVYRRTEAQAARVDPPLAHARLSNPRALRTEGPIFGTDRPAPHWKNAQAPLHVRRPQPSLRRSSSPPRLAAATLAKIPWVIGIFGPDGEVMFAGEWPADKPSLPAYAAPQSCLRLTSPSGSLLVMGGGSDA